MFAGRMVQKSKLNKYETRKTEITKELFLHNAKGSSLLFEPRAGTLRTRACTSRYKVTGASCSVCGNDSETMRDDEI